MIYDTQFFINFFEAIPEDKWCVNALRNSAGQCCALGHVTDINNPCSHLHVKRMIFSELLSFKVPEINNGKDPRYQQSTPKQRILAALRDVQKLSGGGAGAQATADSIDCGPTREAVKYEESSAQPCIPGRKTVVEAGSNPAITVQKECVHMWLECGVCMICSATKPITVKELA